MGSDSLSGIAKRLPKWLRESEGGKALRDAEFNLVPSNVRWSSGLTKDRADYSLFSVPVTRPEDELIQPTVSLTHIWRNTGGLTWQPLGMLSLNSDITSTRDLRVYPDSTSLGRLAYAEREFFLGIPVGVERNRTVSTALRIDAPDQLLAPASLQHQQQFSPFPDADQPGPHPGGWR